MNALLDRIEELGLSRWQRPLAELILAKEDHLSKGDRKGQRYQELLQQLPELTPASVDFGDDRVRIGEPGDIGEKQRDQLLEALRELRPWRKGPFRLFGIDIDGEWASNLKWDRLKAHIAPLAGRRVLDIGSSNGYYLFRMAEAGAQVALGVEPYLTSYFQFRLLQHFARHPTLFCLPARFEELPVMEGYFDTVFSMGVLSHRRDPLTSLAEMRRVLRRGGELVLETLVIEGEEPICLCPQKRYARMGNVFFLPTVACLDQWLQRTGFEAVRCLDVTRTGAEEQRRTEWVNTESLADFLDPADPGRTVEGYPAPVRALLTARAR